MTEDYLQLLWAAKRFPTFNFTTSDNQHVQIIDVGKWNKRFKGPDFKMGKIRVDDLMLVGQVEIHVKSSDWIRHRHHLDSQYNNVILHVVYEHDHEVVQNGRLIPTIEIKNHLDPLHYQKFLKNQLSLTTILCKNSLRRLPQVYLESMKAKSIESRYSVKYAALLNGKELDEEEIAYQLLAMSFGTKYNTEGFRELSNRLSWKELKDVPEIDRSQLLIVESGSLVQDSKMENRVISNSWNKKGTRPASFPIRRIRQFAALLSKFDFDYLIQNLSTPNCLKVFHLILDSTDTQPEKLSRFMKDQLVINCLVPLLWILGERRLDQSLKDRAYSILLITKPEKSETIRAWLNAGAQTRSAFDSQGLLALGKVYCSNKKCLSCEVGKASMKT